MTHINREYKNALFQQFARIGKALGSSKRLELLDLLCQGPRTVEALARQSGQTVANASQHLRILHSASLVESEKDGLYVTYRLAGDEVGELYRMLRRIAELRLADVERATREYLERRDQMEPIDRDALIERARAGEVTVLDVRPREEFDAAHITGALSVPLAELDDRLSDLPRDRDIIAYCRGPYCILAVEAVATLRAHGFTATRLGMGVPEWKGLGFDVTVGEAMHPTQ